MMLLYLFQAILTFGGFYLLFAESWKIALGVFLVAWSINVGQGIIRRKLLKDIAKGL